MDNGGGAGSTDDPDPLADAQSIFEAFGRFAVTSEMVDIITEVLKRPKIHRSRMDVDYYRVLGLGGLEDCSMDAISKAYRQQAMRYHPDRNGSPEAAQAFDRCTTAYEVLKCTDTRASYDALLAVVQAQEQFQAQRAKLRERLRQVTLETLSQANHTSNEGSGSSGSLEYYRGLCSELHGKLEQANQSISSLTSENSRLKALSLDSLASAKEFDFAHRGLSERLERLSVENRSLKERLQC